MRPRPLRRAQALAEALERRALLSLSPLGAASIVNTITLGNQMNPAVARDGFGLSGSANFVATWQGDDGNGYGIFARRYNAASAGTDSAEFVVNSYTSNSQSFPAAAMDADGDFVIAWQSLEQDGSSSGIYAQRYNTRGQRQGNEFRVNATTTGNQELPAVAMDANGNFVVAWTGSQDIYARRYSATGLELGGEFLVNTVTTNLQTQPAVAMDADGDFVVAWQSYSQDAPFDFGVYARQYNSAGVAAPNSFRVNTYTTSTQLLPSVGMDATGDFAIAWQSYGQDGSSAGVLAMRYNAAGVEQPRPVEALPGLGNEFLVNTTTSFAQGAPALAMDANGDFVVAWSGAANGTDDVFAQSFSTAGIPQGLELKVNQFTTGNQASPVVSLNHEGDAIVIFQSAGQDRSGQGIYALKFDQEPDTAGAMVTDLLIGGEPVTPGERVVQSPPNLVQSKPTLVLYVSEYLSTVGGAGGAHSAWNPSNYSLTVNGSVIPIIWADFLTNSQGTGRFEVTLTAAALWSPLTDGNYVLTMHDSVHDLAGNALDGDRDGVPGGDYVHAFTIAIPGSAGPEFPVNTFTFDTQADAAIASDAAGNFVVVWDGRGLDDVRGIHARRYNAAGVPQGDPFRVNTATLSLQTHPAVAMDSDGDFVIVWSSVDQPIAGGVDSGYGIFAQRYNAAGSPQGLEFHVNQYTTNSQDIPSAAMSLSGEFVITWESFEQEGANFQAGIYARRYGPEGQIRGDEFHVNTFTTGFQADPKVAVDADGDFAITYWGIGPGSVSSDVYVRRFDKLGAAMGAPVRVNTHLPSDQFWPGLAMDADGEFVVVWASHDQSGASDEIYAQRYDSAGNTAGGEFLVNSITTGRQWQQAIAMDADGDFVVSWETGNNTGTISYGIVARRFNAQASPLTGDFTVNSFTSGQRLPAVAMDADGDFVIVWQNFGQDGSNYGIYAQRYGIGPNITASAFHYDTWAQLLSFTFNQDVQSSLTLSDFVLENLTTAQTIPSSALSFAYQPFANVVNINYVGNGYPDALPDGDYRATFVGSGVIGPLGLPMQQQFAFSFFVFAGDADHDRDVDVNDLGILASNWQQAGRTFSQGDFDYSGTVDVNDLGILATRWQQSLAAPSAPFAASGSTRKTATRLATLVL